MGCASTPTTERVDAPRAERRAATPATPTPTGAATATTDAASDRDELVADRLHDLSGSFLLYAHASGGALPDTLEQLAKVTGLPPQQITDPATGRPYAYSAAGFAQIDTGLVIVTASPATPGADHVWAVVADSSSPTPVCRVRPVPRSILAVPSGGGGER